MVVGEDEAVVVNGEDVADELVVVESEAVIVVLTSTLGFCSFTIMSNMFE